MRRLIELLKVFMFPMLILAIHFVIGYNGFYDLYTWIDIPMHFLGGFSVAVTFILLVGYLREEFGMGRIKGNLFLVVIIGVLLTAILWEFAEFFSDFFFGFNSQQGIGDTLGDLFFGVFGGILGYVVYSFRK